MKSIFSKSLELFKTIIIYNKPLIMLWFLIEPCSYMTIYLFFPEGEISRFIRILKVRDSVP